MGISREVSENATLPAQRLKAHLVVSRGTIECGHGEVVGAEIYTVLSSAMVIVGSPDEQDKLQDVVRARLLLLSVAAIFN
jgi:hypothetical protein